ncbi:MAG TPA: TIR domain-containing protein [Sporichthyaceae bacterium]|nr:TIR domain-containing protein [Sporichthyaceae bacterium]
MSGKKTIFIAFAKDDEATRRYFTEDRIATETEFEFIDLSVDEAVEPDWQDKVRSRIGRSDGVIALISTDTQYSTRQLWEITCAVEGAIPLVGIWIQTRYRGKPPRMGSAPFREWTWENISAFIDSL